MYFPICTFPCICKYISSPSQQYTLFTHTHYEWHIDKRLYEWLSGDAIDRQNVTSVKLKETIKAI